MRESRCCIAWKMATEGINVTVGSLILRVDTAARFDKPQDRYMANALEKLLKYTLGNYCPMCGRKLKKDKE